MPNDALVDAIARILLRHDPMRIDYGLEDEYAPEARTIAGKLSGCSDVKAARRMIHGEFVSWFAEDLAGAEESYQQIAHEVWELVDPVRR